MKSAFVVALLCSAVLFATAAVVAAPGQDRTLAAGQPTQARVWIQNRGVGEAVPVTIAEVGASMRVRVEGTPEVQITGTPTVQTRPAPKQQWEYQSVTVPTGADPAANLNAAGLQGWETTGLQLPSAGGTLVVLKRPR